MIHTIRLKYCNKFDFYYKNKPPTTLKKFVHGLITCAIVEAHDIGFDKGERSGRDKVTEKIVNRLNKKIKKLVFDDELDEE